MKKMFLFFSFIFTLSLFTKAQTLNFENLNSMNLSRAAISSAADSNFIYVSNGYSTTTGFTTEIEKYDINKNQWSVFTKSLVAKNFSSSVITGGNLYLFNGNSLGGKPNNKMEVVNLNTGEVTFSTDNPFPTKGGGAAVWNGIIYVFGGSYKNEVGDLSYSDKLYSFNPTTKEWTRLENMPKRIETKGEIINGELYVIGGYNGGQCKRIDKYDISTGKWSKVYTMPAGVSGHATAVYGSKIYIIGDYNTLTHAACYDVNTNTYTEIQPTNMVGRRHAAAAVVKGKLYIMGGNQTAAMNSSLSGLQVATY